MKGRPSLPLLNIFHKSSRKTGQERGNSQTVSNSNMTKQNSLTLKGTALPRYSSSCTCFQQFTSYRPTHILVLRPSLFKTLNCGSHAGSEPTLPVCCCICRSGAGNVSATPLQKSRSSLSGSCRNLSSTDQQT